MAFDTSTVTHSPITGRLAWDAIPMLHDPIIAATFIDLDHLIIPDVFTLGLGVVGADGERHLARPVARVAAEHAACAGVE